MNREDPGDIIKLLDVLERNGCSKNLFEGNNEDALEFIHNKCREAKCLPLYGIKRINGIIHGKIFPSDEEHFWLPQYKLSVFHERWIDKWIESGGVIE